MKTKEPAILIGAIGSVVQNMLAMLVIFGLHLTSEQIVAVLATVNSIGALVVAFGVRARVSPVA